MNFSGVQAWYWQRVSALLFFLPLVVWSVQAYLLWPLDHLDFQQLFIGDWGRVLVFGCLVGFAIHAWLGVGIVIGDYLPRGLPVHVARLLLLGLIAFCLYLGLGAVFLGI